MARERGLDRKLEKRLRDQGWTIRIDSKGHYSLRPPDGGRPIPTSTSPTGGRSRVRQNLIAELRRRGFDDGERRRKGGKKDG